MRIDGYTFKGGNGGFVHTALTQTQELDEVIDAIVEEFQAFEATGRVFTTITFRIDDQED